MARVFDDVKLVWAGTTYTIRSDRMMGAIAAIERYITLRELHQAGAERDTVMLAPLAQAYAAALRHGGADVDADAVYQAMFAGDDTRGMVLDAIQGLTLLMIPPGAVADASAPGNGNRRQRRAAARSSRRPTN
ncbi:hypothetical protein [Bradyrhizobium sp.]|uniref:hypothetical protein n=1 Tax=Bradyrhizobium sp. TaxID=376 RepID=UPI0025C6C634|nr:hypothetical protein [Bradyrhizobium sp.]